MCLEQKTCTTDTCKPTCRDSLLSLSLNCCSMNHEGSLSLKPRTWYLSPKSLDSLKIRIFNRIFCGFSFLNFFRCVSTFSSGSALGAPGRHWEALLRLLAGPGGPGGAWGRGARNARNWPPCLLEIQRGCSKFPGFARNSLVTHVLDFLEIQAACSK